jgi:hypothetical protein
MKEVEKVKDRIPRKEKKLHKKVVSKFEQKFRRDKSKGILYDETGGLLKEQVSKNDHIKHKIE